MTVTTLTPKLASEAGTTKALGSATATDGDRFLNINKRGRVIFEIANASGSSITVSIAAQKTSTRVKGYGTVTKANAGGSLADGATKIYGPFDEAFEDANGYVTAICSAVSSVTICAIELPALT